MSHRSITGSYPTIHFQNNPSLNQQIHLILQKHTSKKELKNQLDGPPGLSAGLVRIVEDGPTPRVETGFSASGVRALYVGTPGPLVLPSDRFHLGSCSKSFLGTLLTELSSPSRPTWTLKVGEIVPSKEEWKSVSVQELMAHCAGISDFEMLYGLGGLKKYNLLVDFLRGGNIEIIKKIWKEFRDEDLAMRDLPLKERVQITRRRRLLEILTKFSPSPKLRGTFQYSNLGLSLVALLMEETMNEPYEDLIRKYIFDALGMKSAGFGVCDSKLVKFTGEGVPPAPNQPWGHYKHLWSKSRTTVPPWDILDGVPDLLCPAGNIHANIEDWLKYLTTHLVTSRATSLPNYNWFPEGKPISKNNNTGAGGGWLILDATKPQPKISRLQQYLLKKTTGLDEPLPILPPLAGPTPPPSKVLIHDGSNGLWYSMCRIDVGGGVAVGVLSNAADISCIKAVNGAILDILQLIKTV